MALSSDSSFGPPPLIALRSSGSVGAESCSVAGLTARVSPSSVGSAAGSGSAAGGEGTSATNSSAGAAALAGAGAFTSTLAGEGFAFVSVAGAAVSTETAGAKRHGTPNIGAIGENLSQYS